MEFEFTRIQRQPILQRCQAWIPVESQQMKGISSGKIPATERTDETYVAGVSYRLDGRLGHIAD